MTLGKSHVGNFTRGSTASYTIPVENISPYGPTSGTVTVNDTLPTGLTPTSATGTGWSCSIASQTVSCVDSDGSRGEQLLSFDHDHRQRLANRSFHRNQYGVRKRRRRSQSGE